MQQLLFLFNNFNLILKIKIKKLINLWSFMLNWCNFVILIFNAFCKIFFVYFYYFVVLSKIFSLLFKNKKRCLKITQLNVKLWSCLSLPKLKQQKRNQQRKINETEVKSALDLDLEISEEITTNQTYTALCSIHTSTTTKKMHVFLLQVFQFYWNYFRVHFLQKQQKFDFKSARKH